MKKVLEEIFFLSKPERVEQVARYFKNQDNEKFLGIYIPDLRKIAKRYRDLELSEIKTLLQNEFHEVKLFGVIVLTEKKLSLEIQNFYLENLYLLTNWDYIDVSAHKILGDISLELRRELATSSHLFTRRASIISTFTPIRKGEFGDTLEISEMLLKDKEDLIHKAVGWMLREVGKREIETLLLFLKKHYSRIPRTTLRYAIEKFPKEKRNRVLKGNF
jgi:3-methyladenine DNA glycosylase AlkD